MKRTRSILLAAVSCSLLIMGTTTRAELPPSAYMSTQAKAPELVTIRVGTVTDDGNGSITIDALVTEVTRTASGLKPGDAIKLAYHVRVTNPGEPMIVGPSSVPIPTKGETTPAFLQKNGDIFEPAAGGMTFNPISREQFASEDLTVRFTELSIDAAGTIHTHARVMSVNNSQAGLKPNATIEIDYKADDDNADPETMTGGPGPIDLRQTYHALLTRYTTETAFHPSYAAGPLEAVGPTTQPVPEPAH